MRSCTLKFKPHTDKYKITFLFNNLRKIYTQVLSLNVQTFIFLLKPRLAWLCGWDGKNYLNSLVLHRQNLLSLQGEERKSSRV